MTLCVRVTYVCVDVCVSMCRLFVILFFSLFFRTLELCLFVKRLARCGPPPFLSRSRSLLSHFSSVNPPLGPKYTWKHSYRYYCQFLKVPFNPTLTH